MSLKRLLCFHKWPRYFHDDHCLVVDGLNRHHKYIVRYCEHCGKRQSAMFHIPREYVEALNNANPAFCR